MTAKQELAKVRRIEKAFEDVLPYLIVEYTNRKRPSEQHEILCDRTTDCDFVYGEHRVNLSIDGLYFGLENAPPQINS
jgi:hypothetical protein